MEVSGQLHATATLQLGIELLVPIGEEAVWALKLAGKDTMENRKISCPCWDKNLNNHSNICVMEIAKVFSVLSYAPCYEVKV
jgi:hypothetical protein